MDRITVFQDEGGAWRWHRVAPNGEVVAASGEAFDSKANATRAAEREAQGAGVGTLVIQDDDA